MRPPIGLFGDLTIRQGAEVRSTILPPAYALDGTSAVGCWSLAKNERWYPHARTTPGIANGYTLFMCISIEVCLVTSTLRPLLTGMACNSLVYKSDNMGYHYANLLDILFLELSFISLLCFVCCFKIAFALCSSYVLFN